ncbi:MAG: hypothetical protein B9S32_03670 [Verrucomicrobia bacterium Tous-C9LFEB]|nr:MAG: hypothetical protein B9S32_03670 [Verrucomicrobia bacterium Tous-C9LFEB]
MSFAPRPLPPREKYSSLAAYRLMLQYIHERELNIGDRLPTHAELVHELGVCHCTLATAMKWLVVDGVLTRRQKAGTIVSELYPRFPKRSIWQVGIVVPPLTSSYFFPVLTHFQHRHLGLNGLADRTYMLSVNAQPSSEVHVRRPSDFSGLEEDIEAGMLNGILTSTRLMTDKIPVCGSASSASTFGVEIDQSAFARQALTELRKRGCRHILAGVRPMDDGFSHLFEEAVEEAGQQMGRSLVRATGMTGVEYGYRLAQQVLASPASRRIDGVLLRDDITAQACASLLARKGRTDVIVATQTNLQIPMPFAVPTILFALDVDELARLSVSMLLKKLLKPSLKPQLSYLAPRLQETGVNSAEFYTHISA